MKVPKGTSDYQATWIVDEDENEEVNEESSEEEEENDEVMDDAMDEEDEDICSQVLLCFISKLGSRHDGMITTNKVLAKKNISVNSFIPGQVSCFWSLECIRDPPSVHHITGRQSLFFHCLSLACSARLLTTTIVFGAGVPGEASCLPVLRTELPVWT